MMSDVVLEQVHKRYGDTAAVRGVDLRVAPGEQPVAASVWASSREMELGRMSAGVGVAGASILVNE